MFSLLTNCYSTYSSAQDGLSENQFKIAVDSEIGSLDNFLYDNSAEQSTTFLKLSPQLFLQTQGERQLFNIQLNTSHYQYQNFTQDNHSDLALDSGYQYKLAENKGIFINAGISENYESRGTGLSLGDASKLNKGDTKLQMALSAGYMYGNKDSIGKVKIELGFLDNRYKTRRDKTRLLDNESKFLDTSFDYLISGQSYFSTNVNVSNIRFKFNSSQDKDKYTGLVGLKWQSSIITELEFLLGYQKINFKEASFSGDDAFKWRVKLNWSPFVSTTVAFSTERDFQEANRLANSYRVVDNYQVRILTDFTEALQTSLGLNFKNEDIIFQDFRENEAYTVADIKFKYKRNEWLSIYLQYTYSDLDNELTEDSYQLNGISLGFSVSI